MVHPIRVSKHKVSGALKVVSDQCALDYSKTEKRQQKFLVSGKMGLIKDRTPSVVQRTGLKGEVAAQP